MTPAPIINAESAATTKKRRKETGAIACMMADVAIHGRASGHAKVQVYSRMSGAADISSLFFSGEQLARRLNIGEYAN